MTRDVLVIHVGPKRAAWWKDQMQALLPELDVQLWDEVIAPEAVTAAMVWNHPEGGLRRFSRLRVIVSIGAGVDHVFADADLPPGVPVLRTSGPDLTQRMTEYVCLHTLSLHRDLARIFAGQATADWSQPLQPAAQKRRVGVMGRGTLGLAAAKALAGLGFDVASWARSATELAGMSVFHGEEQLHAFLARTEILVCLLPLTDATRGILNTRLFDALPPGAALINCGRGAHLCQEDLIPALDRGQLRAAVLDVFETEPLPANHPFWADPRVLVTAHTASLIDPEAGGHIIARNLRAFLAGESTGAEVDLVRGY